MRVTNLTDAGPEIHKAWSWIVAIDAFDHCVPGPLADLIESRDIPDDLRPIIAAIVRGDRQPNKRKAAKLKVPAGERMQIAGSLSAILGLIDTIRHKAIDLHGGPDKGAVMYADRKGVEPNEVIRELEAEARDAINMTAEELGVSTETIENLLRDFRSKIKNYPNV